MATGLSVTWPMDKETREPLNWQNKRNLTTRISCWTAVVRTFTLFLPMIHSIVKPTLTLNLFSLVKCNHCALKSDRLLSYFHIKIPLTCG